MASTLSAIDFIVKISKYCNLRCSYCYEYEQLGDRRRISLDRMRAFFEHVRSALPAEGPARLRFIWHGGEPFLVPLEHYEAIGALQRELFPPTVEVSNLVQTNLTVLTERHLAFLRERRFFRDGIGVSFDLFGDQRIDLQGRLRTRTVLANMQRLKDAGVGFGAISVLSRATLPHIADVFRFYEQLGLSFRVLPYYKSASEAQADAHALAGHEIVGALAALFDAGWVSAHPPAVQPLDEYLRHAVAAFKGGPKVLHDPAADERAFLVDTDGRTYGQAHCYEDGRAYGNVFDEPFGALLDSPARARAIAEARDRQARHCGRCEFHGHCPGTFVAEASAEQRRVLETEGCQVRGVLQHITLRLREAEALRAPVGT